MSNGKKVRIELRFDEIEDRDLLSFIDTNGSTRAGFIKQVIMMYKNQTLAGTPTGSVPEQQETAVQINEPSKKKKRKPTDIGFSSDNI